MDREYYFLVIPVSSETIAFVIVIEAEQLTSKSLPQTIYRHINRGKLSKNDNKRTGIAELMRAYRDFLDFDTSKLLA
jgi:hypothetical protein